MKHQNNTLNIFDVQRFALHDGPGIRTTVFLKGCPLNCVWCHNPESKKALPQLGFLAKKCIGCGLCAEVCPQGVHKTDAVKGHTIDYSRCAKCGRCVSACPNKALKIFGRKAAVDEIIQDVLKDRDFYRRSGGGLTVSGGEAMMQFEPLLKLVKQAKENNIHVCLDTCGYAPSDNYKKIAAYVDVFLFDYKLTDSAAHKKYTGVDNGLILRNLKCLCDIGAKIYLRCPIIPGINDTNEHYQAIAKISRQYKNIEQVNLMAYHDMAKGKTAQIGESYSLPDIKTVSAEQKKAMYKQVESCGCLHLQEG